MEPTPPLRVALDERICRLICPIASAMVGVCLTGIGLLHLGVTGGRRAGVADDLLAIDSLLFLVATLASYVALRVASHRRLHLMEQLADACFILAMLLLTAACFVITYALSA
ncbi:hypothetical protein ACMGDM_00090 [Sphingomonas sp. DT-51]|uniref:hypothetical protein n=1 Tax=Sphingomonas sp. DT-51 TaxID=3396165 RepID=UPI003F19CF74